ncbi:hypothetical protein LNAOJCKE_3032 [Methylorubrum aminovorans]|uniref:Uncharacterized protein n=1 Tax=Methylorubrum aminovorans TaxID=269069 RepID=A0ABQ4UES4_9HYPH|nr:hypothetical protein [Methylorubrum aminovorans]GJE65819.1 hypothetical protein LNAOJCKE_3032 [Methylorubrum aminovorans]GMA75829.1 hypothetical protein GCM10025880_22460 [Methylorubrum aminovorans]
MADRTPYSLTVERTADGPRLVAIGPDGERAAEFDMARDGARLLARELLAASGDGTERTFTPEAARG